METKDKEKIAKGLVGCNCITKELAVILDKVIEREKAIAKSHINEPYGEPKEVYDFYKDYLEKLELAEDAFKGLDLCE